MKKVIWFILRIFHVADFFQLKILSYLKEIGWFNSYYKKSSVDRYNNPIPWCTYPFISFLEPRLKKSFSVFEFGSGNSTLWFASRVDKITSLEHDKAWFEKLAGKMPANAELIYEELDKNGKYANYLRINSGKYDIIIVDGRDRVNCVKNSIGALSDTGILVFDNSDVECYSEAMQLLKDNEFNRIDFYGISPITAHGCCTTIFYRKENCLEI